MKNLLLLLSLSLALFSSDLLERQARYQTVCIDNQEYLSTYLTDSNNRYIRDITTIQLFVKGKFRNQPNSPKYCNYSKPKQVVFK